MKTVFAKVTGTPKPNDLIVLGYRSSRGGQTHVMHRARGQRVLAQPNEDTGDETPVIIPPDTAEDVAKELVQQALGPHGWMKEAFEVKGGEGGRIIIHCTGLVQDVAFFAHVEGSDQIKVDLEEI